MMFNGIELEFEPYVSPVDQAYKPVVCLSHNPILNSATNLMVSLDDDVLHRVVSSSLKGAAGVCDCCSSRPDKHGLVVAEAWEINDESQVQSFVEFKAICRECLRCQHFIHEFEKGNRFIVVPHLMLKNGWTKDHTDRYVAEKMLENSIRSKKRWMLSTSELERKLATLASN